MGIKFSNNAASVLAAGVTNSATSCTVAAGDGAKFPTLGAGDYFRATISSGAAMEIVKVTARAGDVLTISRAEESTTALAFSSGAQIALLITAQDLAEIVTSPGGLNTHIQFNNAGVFGGSANLIWDGTNLQTIGATNTNIATVRANTDNASSYAGFRSVVPDTVGNAIDFGAYGQTYTTNGMIVANSAALIGWKVGGVRIIAGAAGPLVFGTGGIAAANERARFDATGNLGISASTGGSFTVGAMVHLRAAATGQQAYWNENTNAGTGAYAAYFAMNSNGTGDNVGVYKFGGGFTTSGIFQANDSVLINNSAAARGRVLIGNSISNPILFFTAGTATTNERFQISATGQIGSNFGGGANANPSDNVHFKGTGNARHSVQSDNLTNSTTAYAQFGVSIAGVEQGGISTTGSSWTASGCFLASQTNFFGYATNGINIVTSVGPIRILSAGSATTNERMRIEANGDIKFFNAGTQKFHWDMVNGRFNFNDAATIAGNDFYFVKSQSATSSAYFQNANTSTGARMVIAAYNSANYCAMWKYGTGYSGSGLEAADMGMIYNGSGQMIIGNSTANPIIFAIGGLATTAEAMRLTGDPNANAATILSVKNVSTGTAASAGLNVKNSSGTFNVNKYSTGFTTNGLIVADLGALFNSTGAMLIDNFTNNPIIFAVGGFAAANEVLRLTANINQQVITFAGGVSYNVKNNSSDVAAYAAVFAYNDAANEYLNIVKVSTTYTTAGLYSASAGVMRNRNAGDLVIVNDASGKAIIFAQGGTATTNEVGRFDTSGLTLIPQASVTPSRNGDLQFQATSNTSLTFKYKGSDGTVRSGSITLA